MIESWLQHAVDKRWPPLSAAVVDEGSVSVRFKRRNDASPITADGGAHGSAADPFPQHGIPIFASSRAARGRAALTPGARLS